MDPPAHRDIVLEHDEPHGAGPNAAGAAPSLQLIGKFRCSWRGRDVTPRGRKARGVLGYLALHGGQSASREQLATLLWTDRGQEQARASLRQTLAELKSEPALAQALTVSRETVEFGDDAFVVDCLEIDRVARQGDLAALAALLEPAEGDLLEDLADLSPGFDEWLRVERARRGERVLAIALEAVEQDGLDDMKNARLILRSLDRLDPYDEALARLGMRLDHAAGDMASLHRRFRSLQDRLRSEFDVPPSQETRALLQELLAGEGPARPPALHRPPDPPPAARLAGDLDLVPTVVVTAVQAHGTDADLGSLASFCSEDIRAALGAIRGIRVLDGRTTDAERLARHCDDALGLYLLSGATRRAGDELRIALQLSNAASQVIVWSDSLRLSAGAPDLIDRIVAAAAGAVKPAIDRELRDRLVSSVGEMDDRRALYTRARLLIRQTGGGLAEAQEGARLLEQVIAQNPRHLGAHLMLARMYNTDFWQQVCGHDVAAYRARSERHTRAAAAIAPERVEVRIRQAWCFLRAGQGERARRELDAVIDSLSHDPDVVNECACAYSWLGDLPRARTLMQRAFALNPFPTSDYHADYAVLLALEGEAQTAEEHFGVLDESGMHYAAIRLANAAQLERPLDDQAVLVSDFATRFRRAWQRADAPGIDDVMAWVGATVPLNPPEHLEFVRAGLRQLIAPSWPAAAASS